MSTRTVSSMFAFAPARLGLAVAGTITALLAVCAAVRPDMLMAMLHGM